MKKIFLFMLLVGSLFANEAIQKRMNIGGTQFILSEGKEIVIVDIDHKELFKKEELEKISKEKMKEVCSDKENIDALNNGDSSVKFIFIHKIDISIIKIDSCNIK